MYCSHPTLNSVWSQELNLTPAPLLPQWGVWGVIQAHSRAFFFLLPTRTLCTKALKQPPLWHDDNVQFHTASWDRLFIMCVKYFWKKKKPLILDYLTCCLRKICQSLYWCKYKNRKPNISMRTVGTHNLFWDLFLCWFGSTSQRYYCAEMRNVCRLCYTVTVKCSFSMSCTDFGFLFIQTRWSRCWLCIGEDVSFALNVLLKKIGCSLMGCSWFHFKNINLRWLISKVFFRMCKIQQLSSIPATSII